MSVFTLMLFCLLTMLAHVSAVPTRDWNHQLALSVVILTLFLSTNMSANTCQLTSHTTLGWCLSVLLINRHCWSLIRQLTINTLMQYKSFISWEWELCCGEVYCGGTCRGQSWLHTITNFVLDSAQFGSTEDHLIKWIKSGVNSGINSGVNSGVNTGVNT